MHFGLLLILLLSSCSANASEHEVTLNRYAQIVEEGGELTEVLTHSALVQAQASRQLMEELGYTQRGRAQFEIWSFSKDLASGCLDLTEIAVVDDQGSFLSLGQRRSSFTATFTRESLISEFEVGQEGC